MISTKYKAAAKKILIAMTKMNALMTRAVKMNAQIKTTTPTHAQMVIRALMTSAMTENA